MCTSKTTQALSLPRLALFGKYGIVIHALKSETHQNVQVGSKAYSLTSLQGHERKYQLTGISNSLGVKPTLHGHWCRGKASWEAGERDRRFLSGLDGAIAAKCKE